MTTLASTPLYDLFDGLGRRRRLRQQGFDPDVRISLSEEDDEPEVTADQNKVRSHKAA